MFYVQQVTLFIEVQQMEETIMFLTKSTWYFAVTGSSRGYAFVEYETEKEMRRAYEVIQALESFNFTWAYSFVPVFGLHICLFILIWMFSSILFLGY